MVTNFVIEKVEFTPEKIKGKDRPRYRRVGNYVQTYTTSSTKSFENGIRYQFEQQVGSEYSTYDGRVSLNIEIHCAMPKSWSNKAKSLAVGTHHTNKPDIDNILKALLDALNGIAYSDDKQVCHIFVSKRWAYENKINVEIGYLDKIKDLD